MKVSREFISLRWLPLFVTCCLLAPQFGDAVTIQNGGVGGGGFLFSGTFHPNDPDIVLIGGDNCGVYRSDDYAESWYLWTDGMWNNDDAESDYVEDLIGVTWDGGNRTAFLAATRGGIFWRSDQTASAPWERLTPPDNFPATLFYHVEDNGFQSVLPFSCLDWDGGSKVFAGAGVARYSPPFAANETLKEINIRNDINPPLSTIWVLDLQAGVDPAPGDFQPFDDIPWAGASPLDSACPGDPLCRNIRDITATEVNGTLYVAAATPDGIYLHDSVSWLPTPIHAANDCWSVHITKHGTLYAAFESGAVRRIAYLPGEIGNPLPWSFETVDCAPGTCNVPPNCGLSVSGIPNLALLTVRDADVETEADVLLLTGHPIFSENNSGLYRAELVGKGAILPGFFWQHWLYSEFVDAVSPHKLYYAQRDGAVVCSGTPNGAQVLLPPGYIDEYGGTSFHHPIVSPLDPDRVVFQMQGRLHKYDATNDAWLQRYTADPYSPFRSPVSCVAVPDSFWQSTGYNQNAVPEFDFRPVPTGLHEQALVVTGDFGLLKGTSCTREHFEREVPRRNTNCSQSEVIADTTTFVYAARHVHYDPMTDAIYVPFSRGGQPAGRIMRWTKPTPSTHHWHNITINICGSNFDCSGIPTFNCNATVRPKRDNFEFGDVVVIPVDAMNLTLYAIYAIHDPNITSGSTAIESGVLVGTTTDGGDTWSWDEFNDGLNGPVRIVANFLSPARLLYNGETNSLFLTDAGNVYVWDFDNATPVWVKALPGPNTPNFKVFRSIAQSADGKFVYLGMAGRNNRTQVGKAGVLRCNVAFNDPATDTNWIDITPSVNPFGFQAPFYPSFGAPEEVLPEIWALAVDPWNNQTVYAGIHSGIGTFEQEGLWRYKNGSWGRFPVNNPLKGVGVLGLGFENEGDTQRELWIGTAGLGAKHVQVNKPSTGGGGSGCPYVYVYDGTDYREDNTILAPVAAQVAGRAAANVVDRYVLQQPLVADGDGKLRIEIREFENERSYIDKVELIAVDHPTGTDVAVLEDGRLISQREWVLPISAAMGNGGDVLASLLSRDGATIRGHAGDYVDLVYRVPAAGLIGLTSIPGQKEPPLPTGGAATTGIEAMVRRKDGRFASLGTFVPRERLAPRILTIPTELLTGLEPGQEFNVRLQWRSTHTLDFAGLLTPVDAVFTQQTLGPPAVRHSNETARNAALGETDGHFVELGPGETLSLEIDAPAPPTARRSYVLVTEGHYETLGKAADALPTSFHTYPNVPNPFNPTTSIRFDLPSREFVSIQIYSVAGQLVKTLWNDTLPAGRHAVEWDGRDNAGSALASGVYFYRLNSRFGTVSRKMLLLK